MKLYQIVSVLAVGKEVVGHQPPAFKDVDAVRSRLDEVGKQLDKHAIAPKAPAHLAAKEVYLDVLEAEALEADVNSDAESDILTGKTVPRTRFSFVIDDKDGLLRNNLNSHTKYTIEGRHVGLPKGQEAVLITKDSTVEDLGNGQKKIEAAFYIQATLSANDYDVWRALRIGATLFCDGVNSHTDENARCNTYHSTTAIWSWPGFASIFARNVDSWSCNRWRYKFNCDLEVSKLACEAIGEGGDGEGDSQGRSTICYLAACQAVKPEKHFVPPTPYPFSPTHTTGIVAKDTVWSTAGRLYRDPPTSGYYKHIDEDACEGFRDTTDVRVDRTKDDGGIEILPWTDVARQDAK